ncbi:uncharacterized protein LOC129572948 [Sitodiplosis mosellana]|uniref:uncharacterized protein LOC129572948 n=1 Tax=Sitodiplosis mosellana TaxID=263140 RepID=UPI002443A4FF|nr:uncharacterized protein LOC129572948 [Sitodiplosis mosellana]
MTQAHIDWRRNKMKVNLAVETLSGSTADSMELLMNKGLPQFAGAGPTIEFIRVWNTAFDIHNTKNDKKENPFKKTLSVENATLFFEFIDKAVEYIKRLRVVNDEGKLVRVCNSKINTGFNGCIIDMISLKMLFGEFVQERKLIASIPTYVFQQDQLEIFFGKIRSLGGYNDNPTCEQFSGAFRKLLVHSTVMTSKSSNCRPSESHENPYSNILSITSQRSTIDKHATGAYSRVSEDQIEELYDKMSEIEAMEVNQHSEDLTDYTVAHIANLIENRIKSAKQFNCTLCKHIFDENREKADTFDGTKFIIKPCYSTFCICKQADRFLKEELLKGTVDFNVIYHEILLNLNFEALYNDTDFSEHFHHKIFLIRFVVDEYAKVKGTHMARSITFRERQKSLRSKLHKLLHYLGQ